MRRQSAVPGIAPREGKHGPLLSVMMPTYNCDDTLERTLLSVLPQAGSAQDMQIEVVDDVSTMGDPQAVVARIGKGRVGFHRRVVNGGHVANFNTCIERSRGRFVHILHGDDWVEPGFYDSMRAAIRARPDLGYAFCRSSYRDEHAEQIGVTDLEAPHTGVIDNWLERILEQQRICTPSVVVRRAAYETVGGFDPQFRTAGEDWEMWARIAACFPVWFEQGVLACYTVRRDGSLTGDARSTTRVTHDMRIAADAIEARVAPLLPEGKARQHLTKARLLYAGWSLNYAEAEIGKIGLRPLIPHLREAFLCYPSVWMAKRISKLALRRPLD